MTGKASESTQKERTTRQEAGMLENALQYWKSSTDPQHRLDLLKTFRLALVENQFVYVLTVQQSNYAETSAMWNTLVSTRSNHRKSFTLYPAAFHEGGVVYIAFLSREKPASTPSPERIPMSATFLWNSCWKFWPASLIWKACISMILTPII